VTPRVKRKHKNFFRNLETRHQYSRAV